ncbi:hypothetical protein D9M72_276150 [compost metagenome]
MQLTQPLPLEAQLAVDALRAQGAVQQQPPVGKVEPAVFFLQAQYAAAGVHGDAAIGTAGRQVQPEVGIQFALPGEVFRQPARQAGQGEVAQAVVQFRFGHQALLAAAQARLSGTPAMGAEVELAIGQPLQPCRRFQTPLLAAGLDFAARQPSAPVAGVQLAVQRQQQVEQRPVELELQLLAHAVTRALGGERAEFVVAGGQTIHLNLHAAALGGI